VTQADIRRIDRITKRDLQTSPKPTYPRVSIDKLSPEERAKYDTLGTDGQRLITLMLNVLSDIKPGDRLFMFHQLVSAAEDLRMQRLIAEQDDIEEDMILDLPKRQADDDFDPWEDIVNVLP
jgi:hypothetical protein